MGEVNESDVNKVAVGAEVNNTHRSPKGRTFPAVVEYVSPKGIDKNGTILFEVKAALTGQDLEGIRAGFSGNAEVELDDLNGVMSIPESCVNYRNGSPYVMVSKNGGNSESDFEERAVEAWALR